MEYNFNEIEKKWQDWWTKNKVYKVYNDFSKPKYYVLDMFPYPSGAGLHVGHPLGYIASDIFARYKRLKGFNVLHPMGYDAFGLPAEQYAIEHGIHPAVSTANNIKNFRSQLDKIGFCFDWDREVKTCDPKFYKWTQWIFLQLFKSYFNRSTKKAEPVESLIKIFEVEGNIHHECPGDENIIFNADEWKSFDEKKQQDILMNYRLAYCGYGEVNWCEELGTVLANDEVVNGVSERGGHPVVKKKLRQWYLRITEYADRLLEGLKTIGFSDAMKEMETNWIGKSYGAEIEFRLTPNPSPHGEGSRESGHYFQTADSHYWQVLKEYARDNRQNATEAEDILWQRIRNNQLGIKVRRQHAIKGFIADFALLSINTVIEIDGEYHNETEQKEYDEAREHYLKDCGFSLLRFTNDEVKNETEKVIEKIKDAIKNNAKVPLLREEKGSGDEAVLKVYTTRPDTIFGVDFMVVAPELDIVNNLKSAGQAAAVDEYLAYVKSRSDRERQAEKKVTGCFTGSYAVNPFNGKQIPVWISEYVLSGYGTGAIMAVPCGDDRDFRFAKHFNIPITNIIGDFYNGEEANATKEAILQNSEFLNGMKMKDAIEVVIDKLEEMGIGKRKVNYKMRDAAFSRQRYWGEPFPIVWKDGIAYPLPESELPLLLPEMKEVKPGKDGEGPLSNNEEWLHDTEKYFKNADASLIPPLGDEGALESSTMPGYAGSSWYFLRYMDPDNESEFCNRKVSDYWNQVDLYIGGTEHAVGHILYSRMWTKVLHDLGFIGYDEPYKKLVNQGMIQGSSRFVYRAACSFLMENGTRNIGVYFVSKRIYKLWYDKTGYKFIDGDLDVVCDNIVYKLSHIVPIHVDVNLVDGNELDIEAFKKWKPEYADAQFILEDRSLYSPLSLGEGQGVRPKYICGAETEKMSKSKFNTVNPDDLVLKYGADTFRMYEMFLGPVEQSKPWDTKGIEGIHRFLKKLWRLFYPESATTPSPLERAGGEAPTDTELKILHKAIKKIEEDTERFSFNTAVSAFMVAVNELADVKCNKREILEPLLIMLAPYAPHIAEELWHDLGNTTSILNATYPTFNEKYLTESSKKYPVSINGKLRTTIDISLDAAQADVEKIVLANDVVKKWVADKPVKKIIFVKNKMVNVVV